jgi:hypothetical protein
LHQKKNCRAQEFGFIDLDFESKAPVPYPYRTLQSGYGTLKITKNKSDERTNLPRAPVSLSLTDVERLCMLEEGGRWRLWLEPERLILPTLFVSSL